MMPSHHKFQRLSPKIITTLKKWIQQIYFEMDQEFDSQILQRYSNRLSQEEKKGSSIASLQRSNIQFQRKGSFTNKFPFLQMMNSEGSQRNQEAEKWLSFEDHRRPLCRNSEKMQGKISHMLDIEQEKYQNKRNTQHKKIYHECSCEGLCNEHHCPCLNSLKELCIIGECCHSCILEKNRLMKEQIRKNKEGCICRHSKCQKSYCKCFQAGKKCVENVCECQNCENTKDRSQERKHQFPRARKDLDVGCNCKRSHCLKRYCKCFNEGKQCGPMCCCDNCHNMLEQGDGVEQLRLERQRYSRVEENDWIDRYLAPPDYQTQEMPRSMEFEHPNLLNSYDRN